MAETTASVAQPELAPPIADVEYLPAAKKLARAIGNRAWHTLNLRSTRLALSLSLLTMAAPAPLRDWGYSEIDRLVNGTPELTTSDATPYEAFEDEQSDLSIGDGLYTNTPGGEWTSVWHTLEALDGTYTLSIPRGPHQAEYQAAYDQTFQALSQYRRGSSRYPHLYYTTLNFLRYVPFVSHNARNDDAAWAGKQFVRNYENTHNTSSLKSAEEILAQGVSQWDKNGGGTYWSVQPDATNKEKAAISNTTYSDLAYKLFKITGNEQDLAWSQKFFSWTQKTLYDPKSGEFKDHESSTGKIDGTEWSYVQGEEALDMADLSQAHKYPVRKTIGFVKHTLQRSNYCDEKGIPGFRAIYIKDLMKINYMFPSARLLPNIRLCLTNSIQHLPEHPQSLANTAGVVLEKAEAALPPKDYGKLA